MRRRHMRLAILLSCAALTAAAEPAFLEYTMLDVARAKQRLAGSPLLRIAELHEWTQCYDEVLKQLPDQAGGSMVKLWQARESQIRVGFPVPGVELGF